MGPRDAGAHPLVLAANVITAFAFFALALALPGLARTTRLPRWALYTSTAACGFIAAAAWTFATYGNHVKGVFTDTQAQQLIDDGSVYLDLLTAPKILLSAIGFAALAIIGWRRRAVPPGLSVLLILAAVVSLLAPPWPGGLLAAAALAWLAYSARTTSHD